MPRILSESDVIALLKKRQGDRTAKDFAAELGISGVYLGDVYAGRRAAGEKILSQLGLMRAIVPVENKRPKVA